MDGTGRPVLSVVIPAHDEARVMGRCLRALAPLLDTGQAEVVVVANGCTDATAAVARAVGGVRVIEVDRASKSAALNEGDAAVSAFPRVYLDADVEVDARALLALSAALPDERPLVGAPAVTFEVVGRPWSVRAYYRVYAQLPYRRTGLGGLYAISRTGRDRFAAFPDVTADDLFVQRCFDAHERVVLRDHTFIVHTPRSLASLVRIHARSVVGARQLGPSTAGATSRALLLLIVRQPALAPAAALYTTVTMAARIWARWTDARWERDDTTR